MPVLRFSKQNKFYFKDHIIYPLLVYYVSSAIINYYKTLKDNVTRLTLNGIVIRESAGNKYVMYL